MNCSILYGGRGGERAVSLASGARVAEALVSEGHTAQLYDYSGGELSCAWLSELRRADAVLLALHGDNGENGFLQAALTRAGIFHFFGAESAACALAMDKARAKETVKKAGVSVAKGVLWTCGEPMPQLMFPAVIKPCCGGSSVGLRIVRAACELDGFTPREPMLCEAYLSGREYSVGILLDRALPVVEILPRGGVYDYTAKYTVGGAEELCPAPLSPKKTAALQQSALLAFRVLGLRDMARIDFKEDAHGVPHFLEANTLPGLTKTSLFPREARAAGISFGALCTWMAEVAAKRKE